MIELFISAFATLFVVIDPPAREDPHAPHEGVILVTARRQHFDAVSSLA